MTDTVTPEERLRDGIAALGLALDDDVQAQLMAYLDEMLGWNEHVNLTAVRDRGEAVTRHVVDSLSVVPVWHRLMGEAPPARVLDLGTGGGFPAAALAAAWPDTHVLAIDGTGKKVRIVAECAEAAGIGNLETLQTRGADLPKMQGQSAGAFQLCVARAVGRGAKILGELAPLCARKGRIFLMKGPMPPRDELDEIDGVVKDLGLATEPAQHTEVPGLERRTVLVFSRSGRPVDRRSAANDRRDRGSGRRRRAR